MWSNQQFCEEMNKKWNLPESVDFDYSVDLCGNLEIGEYTYANAGTRIASGENSKIKIGKYCEIGRYVHIMSYTHSLVCPTSSEDEVHIVDEKDIIIGDYVWIGDKVFIKEGIVIGSYAIIGANSVVTKNVQSFEIVGGVPAKTIGFNTRHNKYKSFGDRCSLSGVSKDDTR